MNWFQQIFSRKKIAADLSAELRQHLDEKIDAFVAAGMSQEDATHAARRAFGNSTLIEQHSREVWMWPFLESLCADIKFATRRLKKSPGFTITVILTLALGIGANSAIFSLTYAILLKSLPVPNPNRLVRYTLGPNGPQSGPAYDALREQVTSADLTAWFSIQFTRQLKGTTSEVYGALMSGNGFAVLELQPYIGRAFGEQDDVPGGGPHGYQALLGYSYWKNTFQGSPDVLGETIHLNDRPITIIGVLPRGFHGVSKGRPVDLLLPLSFEPIIHASQSWRHLPNYHWLTVMGRLHDGQTLQSAKNNLAAIAPRVRAIADPRNMSDDDYGVVDGRKGVSFLENYHKPLLVLETLAGLLLALCCANLALLLLARSSMHSHEFAVRGALGASRRKLFSHVMLEILLLGCAGVAAGVLLGWLLAHSLVAMLGTTANPVRLNVAPNLIILGCATSATLLTALIAGLLPAIHASGTMPAMELKQAQTSTKRMRGAWIVSFQIALSLVLTASAFWLGGTFMHLLLENSGFQPKHVIFFDSFNSSAKRTEAQAGRRNMDLLAKLESTPSTQAASLMNVPPLEGASANGTYSSRDGHGNIHSDDQAWPESVNADYFAALGTRIIEGRGFIPRDVGSTNSVCILSASAAAEFFPGEDAIGRPVYAGDSPHDAKDSCTVVGIAQDAHFYSLRNPPERIVYQLLTPSLDGGMGIFGDGMKMAVRTSNTALTIRDVRAIMHQIDPTFAPPKAELFTDLVSASLRQQRLLIRLSIGFAVLALLLTGVGLFGLLSRWATERTREIGICIAFGAQRGAVVRLVLRSVAIQICVGTLVGAGCAFLIGRAMHSLLYGTSAGSIAVYFASVAAILFICCLAIFIPARRAANVDPMQALRAE